jgi:hypothetical protein
MMVYITGTYRKVMSLPVNYTPTGHTKRCLTYPFAVVRHALVFPPNVRALKIGCAGWSNVTIVVE